MSVLVSLGVAELTPLHDVLVVVQKLSLCHTSCLIALLLLLRGMICLLRSDPCLVALKSCAAFCPWLIRQSRCCVLSDDIWGSSGRCRMVSPCIAAFLVKSWDVRNACKHSGAVLPPLSAPVGRGADGADAMA